MPNVGAHSSSDIIIIIYIHVISKFLVSLDIWVIAVALITLLTNYTY